MQQIVRAGLFPALSLAACVMLAGLSGTAALAGPAKAKPPANEFAIPDPLNARDDVDTDSVFGFTDGSDTNEEGELQIDSIVVLRSGKRAVTLQDGTSGGKGRFTVTGVKADAQYGVTDNFEVVVGVYGDLRNVRNVPDLADKSNFVFDGASVEMTYRLLARTPENPVGISVAVEPRWARVAEQEGSSQQSVSVETKLALDARVIPGLLWYGLNFGFEPQVGRFRSGVVERESRLSISNALTMRVLDHTYLGIEGSYQRAYSGLLAQQLNGEAAFFGPTLFHQFSKKASLSLAWSTQVWGRQKNPAPLVAHNLDLWNFERHLLRAKLSFNF